MLTCSKRGVLPVASTLNQKLCRCFCISIGFYLIFTDVEATTAKQLNSNFPQTSREDQPDGNQVFYFDWARISHVGTIVLWIFCAMLAKIAFHITPKLSHIFPESCLLIVAGIVIGVVMFCIDTGTLHELPTTTFFFFMIPPLVLDAGYFMPSRLFFSNLGTILLFAVVGTIWNAITVGFSLWGLSCANIFGVEIRLTELLILSTLLSAVDSVAVIAVFEEMQINDVLYIAVFGESLLNDAITVVLYNMFQDFAALGQSSVMQTEILNGVASFPVVALGGTLIGILWGFATGFMTKFTHRVLAIEPLFVFVLAYLCYLNAELFHVSGVVAITFCTIIMKRYVEANISLNSSITVKYAVKTLCSSSETIIFIFLGVSTVSDEHVWNTYFVLATITCCTIFRFIGVLWMSALANKFRLHKLNMVDQFVLAYGGLRGAVSFALALLIPATAVKDENIRRMFVTTTISIVFFTVFVQGITIKPLVMWLNIERSKKGDLNMNDRLQFRLVDHILTAMESITGRLGQNKFRDWIKRMDHTYIMPYLIRDYKGSAHTKILETYSKLEMRDAAAQIGRRMTATPEDKIPDITVEVTTEAVEARRASEVKLQPDWMVTDVFLTARRQRKTSYNRHSLGVNDLVVEPISPQVTAVPIRPQRKLGVPHFGSIPGSGYVNLAFDENHQPEFTYGDVSKFSFQHATSSKGNSPGNSGAVNKDSNLGFSSPSVSTPGTIAEESDSDSDVFIG